MAWQTHIIYIPGLGDYYDGFRRSCLRWWSVWGVTTELVPSTWDDAKNLKTKSDSIIRSIDKAQASGQHVVLIGESAGGALVLNIAAIKKTQKVMTLCGVARGSTPISESIRKRAPALDEAVRKIDQLKIDVPIVSLRGALDTTVAKRYSTAAGAEPHLIWSFGHLLTIVLCLTIYAPYVIYLAKKP